MNFNPELGHTIREYSLIEDFIDRSPENRQIFAVPGGYTYARGPSANDSEDDLFHPNDIEPLRSGIAAKYPNFRPGDLLVSFRNLHLVAVLDPVERKIKWWSHCPWRFQHDPDFGEDGRIFVYNNNTGRGGRSDVVAIDPGRPARCGVLDGDLRFTRAGPVNCRSFQAEPYWSSCPRREGCSKRRGPGSSFSSSTISGRRARRLRRQCRLAANHFFDHEPSCTAPATGPEP